MTYQAIPQVRSQLAWFDRTGMQVSTLGELADYGNLELSPDGGRVAVAVMDPAEKTHDIWIYDSAGGPPAKFTSEPSDENWLIWSPDGQYVAFNRFSDDAMELYQAPSSGNGAEELLLTGVEGVWPVSWSADGRFILYVMNSAGTGNDVWVLPLFGDRKPYPIFHTEYAENWAAFSPNGRWIAFSSTVSGVAEVYISPFPANGQVLRVSEGNGTQARWRRDGKEIFYLTADKTLMAVPVNDEGPDLEVGAARSLFQTRFPYPPYHAFDTDPDGQRFLVNTLIFGPGRPTNIAGLN
jgi:eukaryotic-like serine/threonine-protein kinase